MSALRRAARGLSVPEGAVSLLDVIVAATGLPVPEVQACRSGSRYRGRDIARKRPGAARHISIPTHSLHRVLDAVRAELERRGAASYISSAAHGYVAGRSIVTNAAAHLHGGAGPAVVVNFDLKDFFGTVTPRHIRDVLGRMFGTVDLALLIDLCFERGHLPQGAPTSPLLSNIAARSLDYDLSQLAAEWRKRDFETLSPWIYTRYVDDLTFSKAELPSAFGVRHLFGAVQRLVRRCGFRLNMSKTTVRRAHQRQEVTGLVVNGGETRAPREFRRQLRAAKHNAERGRDGVWTEEQIQSAESFVRMCSKEADR